MTVELGYAAQLKRESRTVITVSANAAVWASQGVSIDVPSPFALAAGASAEGARVAAFLQGPLVKDVSVVLGRQRGLIGRCITAVSTALDYAPGGELVFVLGVEELDNGTSKLTILKRQS